MFKSVGYILAIFLAIPLLVSAQVPVPAPPVLASPTNNIVNYSSYNLSWKVSNLATNYEVQLSTDSGFGAGTVLIDSTLTGTSVMLISSPWSQFDLRNYPGIKFYWRVNAQNASGTSSWSAVWNFTTAFPTLTLVSPINGASGVPYTPTLLWRKINVAVFYRVQVSTDSTFTNSAKIAADDSSVTDTSKTLGSLSGYGDSVIYWHVRAKNATGVSGNWSQRWAFSTGTMPVPSAPVLSSPANNTVNYSSFNLSWNVSGLATNYEVQLSTDPGFVAGSVLFDSTLTGTSVMLITSPWSQFDLRNYPGIKFYWRVNAQNASGTSSWSAVWNFTTAFPTLALVSPINGASSVSLTPTLLWRKTSAASTYRVQVSTDSTFTNSAKIAADDSSVTDTSKTLGSLSGYGDSVIYWHVRAKNATGVSGNWSQRWAFSTGTMPVPSAPVLSSPANNTVNYSSFNLSWNVSGLATNYEVQLSTDPGFVAGSVLFDSTLTGTSVMLITSPWSQFDLRNYPGIKFYWRVNAQNASGTSSWSAVWNFTTAFPTLALVSPINGASSVSLTPTLLWRKTSAASTYRVQVSTDSTFTNSAKIAADDSLVTDTSKILGSLSAYKDSVIYWHVRAKNAAGVNGNWSQRWAFSTGTMPVPSAPTLLSPANNTVNFSAYNLAWKQSSIPVTNFEVQLSTDPGFVAGSVLFDSTLTGTSVMLITSPWSQFDLRNYPGIKFYWRVNAQNASGTSSWSAVWNFTTAFPTLALVSPINGASSVSLTPTLLWHKISAAASYRVQASTDSTFTNSAKMAMDDSLVTDTSKILGSLSAYKDSVIYWHVRAKNAAGVNGNWSPRWAFSTICRSAIVVTPGWNMISLNIHPIDSTAQGVFDSLRGFVLAKNNTGLLYWPDFSINTLGSIRTGCGYKIYTDSLDTLQPAGPPVDVAATPISLSAGWNMIAFLPLSDMSVESALAGVVSQVTLVKDNLGQVYMPDDAINTLGDMRVGQGYKLFMKNAAILTYPSGSVHKMLADEKNRTSLPPSRYLQKRSTGNSMTILLKQVMIGGDLAPDNSEIGAFDQQGNLVGCGVVTKGKVAMCVWGDDPQTKAKDGCADGEAMSFKLWDGTEEYPVDYQGRGLLKYHEDGIFTGAFLVPGKMFIKNFALKALSSNPFRNRMTILFDVPVKNGNKVQDVEINIYSLNGSLVHQLVKGKYSTGHFSATWNVGADLSSGSNAYIIRMKAANFENELKLFRIK